MDALAQLGDKPNPMLEFPIPSPDHPPSHPLQAIADNDNQSEDEAINTEFCQTWAAFLFDGSGSTSQTEVPPLNLPPLHLYPQTHLHQQKNLWTLRTPEYSRVLKVQRFLADLLSIWYQLLPTRLLDPDLCKQMLPSHKTTENLSLSATLCCRTLSPFKHKLHCLLWRTRIKDLSFVWRKRKGWLQEKGWTQVGGWLKWQEMHAWMLSSPSMQKSQLLQLWRALGSRGKEGRDQPRICHLLR